MKIRECQILLTSLLSATGISAPDNTHYAKIAETVLGMTSAYESDGITFFKSGDPVNALASFYYGFGWLHFGVSSGLLSLASPPACPLMGSLEILQAPYRAKLEEKTYRYAHLLDTAVSSVTSAPDPATRSHGFAERILFVARVYGRYGNYYLDSSAFEEALSRFSYGHGWLDAGVTAGFFYITAERDLFCV
jgi:hypothetical protein